MKLAEGKIPSTEKVSICSVEEKKTNRISRPYLNPSLLINPTVTLRREERGESFREKYLPIFPPSGGVLRTRNVGHESTLEKKKNLEYENSFTRYFEQLPPNRTRKYFSLFFLFHSGLREFFPLLFNVREEGSDVTSPDERLDGKFREHEGKGGEDVARQAAANLSVLIIQARQTRVWSRSENREETLLRHE